MLDGKAIHHAAHPPLLQLIYAGLYSIFGVHEWVSRSVSLIAVLITIISLWVILLRTGAKRAAFTAALFFAVLPLSVELSRTTNYEPLSVSFISLILVGYLWRDRKWGFVLLCIMAVIGGLFEWTVYLAFPALFISVFAREKNIKSLKPLILPSLLAAITLMALFAYQYGIIGHIPVLGHAKIRSNPAAIPLIFFSINDLKILFGGNLWLYVLCAYGFYILIKNKRTNPELFILFLYLLSVPLLFLLFAPQLVLAHPIAQYYFVPVLAIGISIFTERRLKIVSIFFGIILLVFIDTDRRILKGHSNFHYNLAKLIAQEKPGDHYFIFDSSAVGYLRYYYGVETIYPLGGNEPSLTEIVSNSKVRYFILDTAHPEVGYVRKIIAGAPGLNLKWRLPQTEVWERGAGDGAIHLTNDLERATLPPQGAFWETPQADMCEAGGLMRFGIFHHARLNDFSTIIFKDVPHGKRFKTMAMLDPAVCNPPKSDGVGYFISIRGGDWKMTMKGILKPDNNSCEPRPVEINTEGAPPRVDVELSVSPLGNASFDRFYWEDPRIEL